MVQRLARSSVHSDIHRFCYFYIRIESKGVATSSIIILFMLDNYVHCAFKQKSENNLKQTVF